MATDIPTFKARLLDERTAVAAEVAAIDVNAETVRYNQAQATLQTARDNFEGPSRRWTMVNDKLSRLEELDRQIAYINSLGV
jgi:hypothetical protein